MRKTEALTASLVLLLVLSATARLSQAQPRGYNYGGGGADARDADNGDGNGDGWDGPVPDIRFNRNDRAADDTPAPRTGVTGGGPGGIPGAGPRIQYPSAPPGSQPQARGGPYSVGTQTHGSVPTGVLPLIPSQPSLKVEIQNIRVLHCPDCGENAVVAVKKPEIEFRGPATAIPMVLSCAGTSEQIGGVWIEADLKLKSGTKFAEGSVDFIARTFDCCNPINAQYTPLAEDACDVLSDVDGYRNHKCFGGSGCHKSYGFSRAHSSKVCLKADRQTPKKLETLLVAFPDASDIPVGCKQTEGLFVDGNTGKVLGCFRVQWSVCLDNDCGGVDVCGCGDGPVFNNPRCGRCLQARAERLGICADLFNFAQAPAETCEWRECCCDSDGVAGGTPCSTGNVGACDDKSCRRHR